MAGQIVFILEREHCKGCGLCAAFCQRKLLRLEENLNSLGYHPAEMTGTERCTGCGNCTLVCPDLVITIRKEGIA